MAGESAIHESAARGFARAAEDYERGRPAYPEAAIAWLVRKLRIRPGSVVLDLAAGTGKLTRALAPTGAELVAVEPVEQMRARLAREVPAASALDGAAEVVPLDAASVDAVAVGQAFHWFRGEEALAEIHRVLRPGGRLGLLWNVKDEAEEWVARLGEIIEPHRGAAPRYVSGAWHAAFETTRLFTRLRHRSFSFAQEVDVDTVVARVASISFLSALPDTEREHVLAQVRELLATHPATCGRQRFPLPYRTDVFWSERLAA